MTAKKSGVVAETFQRGRSRAGCRGFAVWLGRSTPTVCLVLTIYSKSESRRNVRSNLLES